MSVDNLPVMKTNCATCPFRAHPSRAGWLDTQLANKIIVQNGLNASHPCHEPQLYSKAPSHFCRGHRDQTLQILFYKNWIVEPTDEAFAAMQNVQVSKCRDAIWLTGLNGLLGRFGRQTFDVYSESGLCVSHSNASNIASAWNRFADEMATVHKIVVFDSDIPESMKAEVTKALDLSERYDLLSI